MKLITAPNPWLHTQTKNFDFDNLDAEQISIEMTSLMYRDKGIGLAANQVELDAQVFVMRPTQSIGTVLTVINPEILEVSTEKETQQEGCLSYPGLYLHVSRPKTVVAKYFDKNHKSCKMQFEGLDARCFLHEYDHLQGITFTDRVSKLKLDRALKKQQKVLKNG